MPSLRNATEGVPYRRETRPKFVRRLFWPRLSPQIDNNLHRVNQSPVEPAVVRFQRGGQRRQNSTLESDFPVHHNRHWLRDVDHVGVQPDGEPGDVAGGDEDRVDELSYNELRNPVPRHRFRRTV